MSMKILLPIIIWLLMFFLAIVNGTVRNYIYKPLVGELMAHQVSTVFFIIIITLVTLVFLKISPEKYTQSELLLVGFTWTTATIIFEFVFGHYVFGNSWQNLVADYNILAGRVWGFVLMTEFLAPLMISNVISK